MVSKAPLGSKSSRTESPKRGVPRIPLPSQAHLHGSGPSQQGPAPAQCASLPCLLPLWLFLTPPPACSPSPWPAPLLPRAFLHVPPARGQTN